MVNAPKPAQTWAEEVETDIAADYYCSLSSRLRSFYEYHFTNFSRKIFVRRVHRTAFSPPGPPPEKSPAASPLGHAHEIFFFVVVVTMTTWVARAMLGQAQEAEDQYVQLAYFISSTSHPTSYKCPLSGLLYSDPVQTIHGVTYERHIIENHFRDSSRDPITGERLITTCVWPDLEKQAAVDRYIRSHVSAKSSNIKVNNEQGHSTSGPNAKRRNRRK